MVGIVCALDRELAPLKRRSPAGCRILAAGMGLEAAEWGVRSLVKAGPLTALISAGFAGALGGGLGPGAIVVDTRDPELETAMPPAVRGKIAQAERLVRTRAERARIAVETGAVAVDMESGVVARVAAECGLRFASVRAITDGPEQDLVLDWDRFRRANGSLRSAAALLQALRSLKGMAELRQLWYASREASSALSRFLAEFLERWNQGCGMREGR